MADKQGIPGSTDIIEALAAKLAVRARQRYEPRTRS